MAQPGRLHSLFSSLPSSADANSDASAARTPSITGHPAVDEVLRTLPGTDLARLLRFVRDWNAKAKTKIILKRIAKM